MYENTHIGHKHFGVQRTLNTQAIQERSAQTVRIKRLIVIEIVVQIAQIIEIIEISTVAAAIVSAATASIVVSAAAAVATIVVSATIAIIPAKHKGPISTGMAQQARTQHQIKHHITNKVKKNTHIWPPKKTIMCKANEWVFYIFFFAE